MKIFIEIIDNILTENKLNKARHNRIAFKYQKDYGKMVCRKRVDIAGLKLLFLEKLACKIGLWLAYGDLDFRIPTIL